jgi:type 1 fimbria pilin
MGATFNVSAVECINPSMNQITISAPSVTNASLEVPIGQVIASTTASWPTTTVSCTMTGSGSVIGVGTPNGNIYPTSIPGIGYRGKVTAPWSAPLTNYWPTGSLSSPYGLSGVFNGGTLLLEFIKTGPIPSTGGTFGPVKVGSEYIQRTSISGDYIYFYLATPLIISPAVPACTITQSAITVNLDDSQTSQLTALGNTSKDKAFSIPLNCTSASNISMGFSGDIADNTNAVFRNLSGSTNATSVGVQILENGTPVPTTVGSYLNLGTINGNTSVALTARYYALTDNAYPGEVSAIAYASILYN